MNTWHPMIPALWICLRVGINELRTTSLNGLGTLTRPRQDTWVSTWIQLGFKMCKTSRFRKIQQDRDTLICLATVSIHFRHYTKNYKTLHPCLQHLQDCYFSNHSSIDVCLDSSREIALCSTAPNSGQCVQVGGPADHTTEGAQQPGSHSCVPWKGSLGSLMDFISLVPYFKHLWSLFWIVFLAKDLIIFIKMSQNIPIYSVEFEMIWWFDPARVNPSLPRCWTEAPHAGEIGISLLSGRHLGMDRIRLRHRHHNMFMISWQCLFITFELRVDRDIPWHSTTHNATGYRKISAEIRLQATACSSRTSSSLGSRDKPKIWVLGSQKVAKSLWNVDLNLAPWQVFLLSSILPLLPLLPLLVLCEAVLKDLIATGIKSITFVNFTLSVTINLGPTNPGPDWLAGLHDWRRHHGQSHPGGMEISGDLGRSREVSASSGLATTPGCSVAVEDSCSMISQIPTQLEMLDVSHCYMLLHILPVETVETDTSDYCQLCRGPSLSSFSPTTGAHLW